jgi:hypothetical protein
MDRARRKRQNAHGQQELGHCACAVQKCRKTVSGIGHGRDEMHPRRSMDPSRTWSLNKRAPSKQARQHGKLTTQIECTKRVSCARKRTTSTSSTSHSRGTVVKRKVTGASGNVPRSFCFQLFIQLCCLDLSAPDSVRATERWKNPLSSAESSNPRSFSDLDGAYCWRYPHVRLWSAL